MNNFADNQDDDVDANKMMEDVFGKDFDYAKEIPKTNELGINSSGSFGQLIRNMNGLKKYANISLKGPPLGVNYFVVSGVCTGGNDDGKPQHTFIRNIPSGHSGLFPKTYKGINPGIVEDVNEINPFRILKKMIAVGKSPDKNLSDLDKKREQSSCKPLKRLEKKCAYRRFPGSTRRGKLGYCKGECVTKLVSNNYDECEDIGKGVFCSSANEREVKKMCEEGFTVKDIDAGNLQAIGFLRWARLLPIIFVIIFTLITIRRLLK